MAKSLSTQEGKKPRSTTSNAKGGRGRRSVPPSTPPNSTSTVSPPSERRATRNVAPPPPPSQQQQQQQTPAKPRTLTAAERKATPKLSTPSPATNAQSSKKTSQQPPILSLASSEGTPNLSQETTTSHSNARLSKNSQQQLPLHANPPLLKSQKRGPKRQHSESVSPTDTSRASKRVRLQHQPFQSPPPPTIIPAILRQQVVKTPEDKIVVFHKGEFLAVRNENGMCFLSLCCFFNINIILKPRKVNVLG